MQGRRAQCSQLFPREERLVGAWRGGCDSQPATSHFGPPQPQPPSDAECTPARAPSPESTASSLCSLLRRAMDAPSKCSSCAQRICGRPRRVYRHRAPCYSSAPLRAQPMLRAKRSSFRALRRALCGILRSRARWRASRVLDSLHVDQKNGGKKILLEPSRLGPHARARRHSGAQGVPPVHLGTRNLTVL